MPDLGKQMARHIDVYYVVHSPVGYPNVDEIVTVRKMAERANYLIVMSWHGYHNMINAFGIKPDKVRTKMNKSL